jgi:hypothetical protein
MVSSPAEDRTAPTGRHRLGPGPAADIPEAEEFEPERWETAIEDFAQVVALGIDRAQDLGDALGDFCSERPGLVKGLGAVAAGVLAGVVLARLTRPRSQAPVTPPAPAPQTEAALGAGLVGALVEVAGALAQALRREPTDGSAAADTQAHRDGRSARPPRIRMQHVAQLMPVAIALARNPAIRDLLVSSAMKAARRRP